MVASGQKFVQTCYNTADEASEDSYNKGHAGYMEQALEK